MLESIEWLNGLSRDAFATALRPLFEAAAPLADALYAKRPFGSCAALIDAAEALASEMPLDQQAEVLAAHPRIGADPETVSAISHAEQGYFSEAGTERAELQRVYARLAELNRAYEERFGFRFVVFVNRRPKAAIIPILEQRLGRSPADELQTGLRNMFAIARDRLGA